MEKDQMPWAQYCLTPQGIKDLMEKYQIIGVPYYLLIYLEGKVIANPSGVENIREFGIRNCLKNLVITLLFCIFMDEN